MRTPRHLACLVLVFAGLVSVADLVQGQQPRNVEGHVAVLASRESDLEARWRAAWELGAMGPAASELIPVLARIVESEMEPGKVRMSALHALGHIGVRDVETAGRILEVVREEALFGGSGHESVVNGSFELVAAQRDGGGEQGAFGERMFQPGSLDLRGWMTAAGVTMLQDEGAQPGGQFSFELGPRDEPGCISQVIATEPGRGYSLTFYTCTGRSFAHFNRQVRVRIGNIERVVDCPVGADSEKVTIPFEAASLLTTITFCGVGTAGFGPVIDEVAVAPVENAPLGTSPVASPNARLRQLDETARRIQRGSGAPEPGNRGVPPLEGSAPPVDSSWIDLTSPAGQDFVGHQLEAFEAEEPGVLGTSRPAWINLYRTERRDFILAGEVWLGGIDTSMLFPEDLPDGFALFLREWDGVRRYQASSRNLTVKRRLLHGRFTSEIIPLVELAPPVRGEWVKFEAKVSAQGIEYSFGRNIARLPGPLDTDGANKIAIAPGTRLRNLRLKIDVE